MCQQNPEDDVSESASASTWAVETMGSDDEDHIDLERFMRDDGNSDRNRTIGTDDITAQHFLKENIIITDHGSGENTVEKIEESMAADKSDALVKSICMKLTT